MMEGQEVPGDLAKRAKARELAEKLDKELEAELLKLEASGKRYMDGWTEENWEEEMEKHPFFATQASVEKQEELSPLMKGLQELKYSPSENSPMELGANYKEDGNFNFKCKKYRLAIVAYSEGLKNLAGADKDVKASPEFHSLRKQLVTNRAAAQFHLGNFRSSLLDSRMALVGPPPLHLKALDRAVHCCVKLGRYKECIEWCDKGLGHLKQRPEEPCEGLPRGLSSSRLMEIRKDAEKKLKEAERNSRKEAMAAKKATKAETDLQDAIKAKGVKLAADGGDLTPIHPMASPDHKVHLLEDGSGSLVWPVVFLYPEFGQMDFVEGFADNQTFAEHLEPVLADPENRPPWDLGFTYLPDKVNLYFEDKGDCEDGGGKRDPHLVWVDKGKTLGQVLKHDRCRIHHGTPAFIIVLAGSKFEAEFLKKYK